MCVDAADDGRVDDGASEGDGETSREDVRDVRDAEDGDTDASDGCVYSPSFDTRPQATPGLECRRLSVDEIEYALRTFAGDRANVVAVGGPDDSAGVSAWLFDRTSACWSRIPEVDHPRGERRGVPSLAVEAGRVASWASLYLDSEMQLCELWLLDLATRESLLLDSVLSPIQSGRLSGCTMDSIALEYPWVVWRDIRRVSEMFYPWDAMAKNIETGETINLSLEPTTGRRDWSGVVAVDLKGGLAVWPASSYVGDPPQPYEEVVTVNLRTGERLAISDGIGKELDPAVTEDWVTWVDMRDDPGATSMSPCLGDIYGYDRRTGEEQALVTEGDVMHGPWLDAEGPWLVYTDHRWDAEPRCDSDREASVVAFHLPTRTEVRVTDWPGREAAPKAYRREDGTYGILLIQEVSYFPDIQRLWDCDLPDLDG